jgi:hypothetical protein
MHMYVSQNIFLLKTIAIIIRDLDLHYFTNSYMIKGKRDYFIASNTTAIVIVNAN